MVEVPDKIRSLEAFFAITIENHPMHARMLAFDLRHMILYPDTIEKNKVGLYRDLKEVGYTDERLQKIPFFEGYNP